MGRKIAMSWRVSSETVRRIGEYVERKGVSQAMAVEAALQAGLEVLADKPPVKAVYSAGTARVYIFGDFKQEKS